MGLFSICIQITEQFRTIVQFQQQCGIKMLLYFIIIRIGLACKPGASLKFLDFLKRNSMKRPSQSIEFKARFTEHI